MKYLVLDGYLNGTGIRDRYSGGFVELTALNISMEMKQQIRDWVLKYENEFYNQYSDLKKIEAIDKEGITIVLKLREELPNTKIEYYSDAKMMKVNL
jgi:hypothetical protein